MYGALGIGQVNPETMQQTQQELGLQGREVGSLNEEDRVSLFRPRMYVLVLTELQQRLIAQYKATVGEQQRRMMMAAASNGGVVPASPVPTHMMAQYQAQVGGQAVRTPGGTQSRAVSGVTRNGSAMEDANTPRGNSPPERKRMRRNSGSAAPSPFNAQTPQGQPQYATPQAQTPQMSHMSHGTPHQAHASINMDQVSTTAL